MIHEDIYVNASALGTVYFNTVFYAVSAVLKLMAHVRFNNL